MKIRFSVRISIISLKRESFEPPRCLSIQKLRVYIAENEEVLNGMESRRPKRKRQSIIGKDSEGIRIIFGRLRNESAGNQRWLLAA
jgi:hypothetical protein